MGKKRKITKEERAAIKEEQRLALIEHMKKGTEAVKKAAMKTISHYLDKAESVSLSCTSPTITWPTKKGFNQFRDDEVVVITLVVRREPPE